LSGVWFVAIDRRRLRGDLEARVRATVLRSAFAAAAATGARIVDACVVPCGLRTVLASPSRAAVRAFARRFVGLAASALGAGPLATGAWRERFRVASLRQPAIPAARATIARMRAAAMEDAMSKARPTHRKRKDLNSLVAVVRRIEAAVDASIGADDAGARIRRYVGEHDAPPDDRVAFARLCHVVFAQGLGAETVMSKGNALAKAFDGFDPPTVARFGHARVAALMDAPIIRNEAKIRACIENARRWIERGRSGSYLGRIAQIAAQDDAAGGWPLLASTLQGDFVRLGEPAARQGLKRWGFFTAVAHPGARRALERLGFAGSDEPGPAFQLRVGQAAQRLGRDPYAIEGVLALFAGVGPCRKLPQCERCMLAQKCAYANAQGSIEGPTPTSA
jgi:hypothetical protein